MRQTSTTVRFEGADNTLVTNHLDETISAGDLSLLVPVFRVRQRQTPYCTKPELNADLIRTNGNCRTGN
jgi:hypothetical protein